MKLRSPHLAALRALADLTIRPRDVRRTLGVETATRRWLIGGVLPLWLGAGLADWHRHKRTRIEITAGTRESMIHSLMMTEAGVPLALGLFCEVNPGVLATCGGALAVHGATAYWDVSYAEERRRVTPLEQHIHSLLEVVPLMATGFLTVLYWDQARGLAGRDGRPDFRIRLKRRNPLSPRTRIALLTAMGVFGALPYAEEMLRCLLARPTLKAQPTADPAPTATLSIPADPQHVTAE
ncbi:diguanylate cyclase [Actinomadura opuntiae]|uniref:diguanylate cyclase n=1 Tax=Actinomadura sp. OS1-43 TaxID=604315 RepID=UPI00255AE2DA|nr:diguanylate cyclase [Actinomadura sp. OS1-43]MDL4812876.1 diguanylate cyclase [Actinomadura sp. OS1-43]